MHISTVEGLYKVAKQTAVKNSTGTVDFWPLKISFRSAFYYFLQVDSASWMFVGKASNQNNNVEAEACKHRGSGMVSSHVIQPLVGSAKICALEGS